MQNELLAKVKEGDRLVRVFSDTKGNETRFDAEIISLDDDVIVCMVMVDVTRRMTFNRHTGISILGEEYGRLEVQP